MLGGQVVQADLFAVDLGLKIRDKIVGCASRWGVAGLSQGAGGSHIWTGGCWGSGRAGNRQM